MLYNADQIKDILPHRYPFLLIDRVDEFTTNEAGNKVVRATKCVSANEQFFTGHFPQQMVMPGVLILEGMAQTGAVYVLSLEEYKGKIVFFAKADEVRWRKPVVPGDVLKYEVELLRMRRNIGYGKALAYVDGEVVAEAMLTFSIA